MDERVRLEDGSQWDLVDGEWQKPDLGFSEIREAHLIPEGQNVESCENVFLAKTMDGIWVRYPVRIPSGENLMSGFQAKAESMGVGGEAFLSYEEEAEGAEPHFPRGIRGTVWNLEESLKAVGLEIICEVEGGHRIRRVR